MKAHLYPDVRPAIQRWCETGIDVRIYSSGSIAAQKLFFGHTVEGNLLGCFRGHYDTTTGPKRELESYQAIANRPEVAWTIPLSLGDSHRGYRVVGTNENYFNHYRFARDRALEFAHGGALEDEHDAVLGAEVARKLGYRVGDAIVVAHGAGDVSFVLHDDQPFSVVGVLAPTGTPVDRTVHVPLEGIDALHDDYGSEHTHDPLTAALEGMRTSEAGDRKRSDHPQEEHGREHAEASEEAHEHEDHKVPGEVSAGHTVSAFLVGLKSRPAALSVQRFVNEYGGEPMTAILPGATLQEVWEILGAVERTLFAVSAMVVVVGLAGMLVALLTSLSERRRRCPT